MTLSNRTRRVLNQENSVEGLQAQQFSLRRRRIAPMTGLEAFGALYPGCKKIGILKRFTRFERFDEFGGEGEGFVRGGKEE